MRFACSNLSRNFSKLKSYFSRENKVENAWIPKINALFHSCLFTRENKTPRNTVPPKSKSFEPNMENKDSKRKSKSKFRVFLAVKTCEVFFFFFYYFPWFYCVDSSVASLHSLFYVTREFHRFLHRGWAQNPEPEESARKTI